ncbi:MAG TPA: hypothetical protein VN843_03310, partial [Anaerolineales bacterium]|nr:hypothetical protein [Anaerolineales bacterium]
GTEGFDRVFRRQHSYQVLSRRMLAPITFVCLAAATPSNGSASLNITPSILLQVLLHAQIQSKC